MGKGDRVDMNITTIQIGIGSGYARLLELQEPVRVTKQGNGLALIDQSRKFVFDSCGRFLREEPLAS